MLANQLMHSDIDVDRMDYLMRDAYHTGVRLGIYDNNLMLKIYLSQILMETNI